ncbi:hypothetical protein KIPB_001174 [Kipferlia bialata]|uniref:Uncharacterized protein n=1 Tax=Kipferlia bialata TaxID=797122 RepID=A0A391NIM7_9EUKA|nr:hypothetical protein KIPB_001174 [Kipferlia bialata]|eukprot:g1174.t1
MSPTGVCSIILEVRRWGRWLRSMPPKELDDALVVARSQWCDQYRGAMFVPLLKELAGVASVLNLKYFENVLQGLVGE